jgi:hypothetical protein
MFGLPVLFFFFGVLVGIAFVPSEWQTTVAQTVLPGQ